MSETTTTPDRASHSDRIVISNSGPCSRLNCEKFAKQVCSRCKHVRYCSRECQVSDWHMHKRYCASLLSGQLTHNFYRCPKLPASQHRFLATWPVDLSVQNLIPGTTSYEWSVPDTLTIAPPTRGIILSHQPLNDRFRWTHNSTLCQYLTGYSRGFVEIYPSGYDYDLTHTLYHVPEGNPPRTVQTADLTIDGVELVGIRQLELPAMASLLEAVIGPARRSRVAYVTSSSERMLIEFVEPEMNKKNTKYMHRTAPNPATMEPKERSDYQRIQRLRQIGIKLTSPKEDWVRECGMNWPEYFFGDPQEENVGNSGTQKEGTDRYGKGPRSDTSWNDYWKWMASKSASGNNGEDDSE